MEKDLQNLYQIFNKKFFRVPDFQRGYSWEIQQLEDFWEDLELLSDTEFHYTGMLTYEKIKNPKDYDDEILVNTYKFEPYYIVDGQQRLTTISILLKCILDKFDDEDIIIDEDKKFWEKKFLFKNIKGYEYFLFGYETDNPSYFCFKNKVLDKKTSDEENKQETIYTRNLLNAKKFFLRELKNLSKDELSTLFNKVIHQLKFNTYEVDEDIEVFVTFETMNNRGKGLSKLELLKNRLIYISTKISKEDETSSKKLRDEINNTWKVIYNYLGKNVNNVLNDDDFLKNHWIMYFSGYNRNEASVFSKFLLKDKFTIRNVIENNLNGEEIRSYVDSLRVSVKSYFHLQNPFFDNNFKNEYPDSLIHLDKLNRLGFSSFLPLLMSVFNKKVPDAEISNTLEKIERFIFVIFKMCKYISTYENANLYRNANKYDSNEITLNDLNNEIDKIFENSYDVSLFSAEIKKRFKDEGWYSWYNELKYLLFEYELYLKQIKNINEDKINWDNYIKSKRDYISIEHIFPQSKIRDEKDKKLCHSLGNLVPLSTQINSKLQDNDFKTKLEKRFKDGSLSERELCSYEKWSEEEIKGRGFRLLNFMASRWNIDIGNDEVKLNLLGFN